MTAEEQVKEIVRILSPETPNNPDAVFVVMDFLTKTTAAKAVLQKQIDLLEARLEVRSQEKHDIINEKLEAEARLKKEKEDIINEHKEQPSYVPKKGGTP